MCIMKETAYLRNQLKFNLPPPDHPSAAIPREGWRELKDENGQLATWGQGWHNDVKISMEPGLCRYLRNRHQINELLGKWVAQIIQYGG